MNPVKITTLDEYQNHMTFVESDPAPAKQESLGKKDKNHYKNTLFGKPKTEVENEYKAAPSRD